MIYDVAVVGLGLIGSAALRHLAAAGLSVVGLGVAEPDDWAEHAGPFASHYDSGRVTRRLDARREWAVLADRAISAYPDLEAETGVRFHHPVGLLFSRNDEEGVEAHRAVIAARGLDVAESLTSEDLPYRLPFGWPLFTEPSPAGFIDPRRMLAAHLVAAERRGAMVRRGHVVAIERRVGGYRAVIGNGDNVDARHVLVATGAYAADLLPVRPAMAVLPEAVVLGEVSADDAGALSDMPALIHIPDAGPFADIYVVPSTRYPDGGWYIKLGGSLAGKVPVVGDDRNAWMAGSAADDDLPLLRSALLDLLPDVSFRRFVAKPCLITKTNHHLPFLDEVDAGLFVAAGGNGRSAKSADALGALAADLVTHGSWRDPELDRNSFRFVEGPFEPGDHPY